MEAYFGKPASTFVPGGAHIAVYVAPVLEGKLVVFDVRASAARGRWLPWDILDLVAGPYATAAALVDDWCAGDVSDLRLVDALSFPLPGEGWELALVFRAEIGRLPDADDARTPVLVGEKELDAIGNFDPADLRRWLLDADGQRVEAGQPKLLF